MSLFFSFPQTEISPIFIEKIFPFVDFPFQQAITGLIFA